MPSLTTRQPAPVPVADQLSRLPPRIPQLPEDVFERFPSLRKWQEDETRWWGTVYSALQTSNQEISQHATATDEADDVLGVQIRIETEEREEADGFLSGKYTLQVIAGDVVTGMVITSSTGPGTTVSDVTFQADRFRIFNGTSGQAVFDLNGANVRISGWVLNATTLTGGNATLDSAGQLILGTSNDVVYLSASDATYRIWIGNATAGSASFRVTKTGTMTAVNGVFSGSITSTSGSIGGFTLSGSALTGTNIAINANGGSGIIVGPSISDGTLIAYAGVLDGIYNFVSGTEQFAIKNAGGGGLMRLNNAGAITITLTGSTGIVDATAFSVLGNNVVGARGTRGAAGLTQVVALLDAWGAWA